MYLIVGLGNPGSQYDGTRHNVGFAMLDYLARKNDILFAESKWKASFAKTLLWGETVILLKPETYMNLSGTSVAPAANYYKIPADKVIVIHDDLDMPVGRVKIVSGGGDGGHRGIRSLIECLGTNDFPRVKIGIGRPPVPIPAEKYVLSRFAADDLEVLLQKMAVVADGIRILLQQGIAAAMNVINQKD